MSGELVGRSSARLTIALAVVTWPVLMILFESLWIAAIVLCSVFVMPSGGG